MPACHFEYVHITLNVAMHVTLNLFRKKTCMRAYTAAVQRQKDLCSCFLVITNFTGEIILCFVLPGL